MPQLVQTYSGDPLALALLKGFLSVLFLLLFIKLLTVIFKTLLHPRKILVWIKLHARTLLLIVLGVVIIFTAGVIITSVQKQADFTHRQCLASIKPQELEGCVFWSRNDSLRHEQDWYGAYKLQEDQSYCNSKYILRCKEESFFGGEVAAPCPDQLTNGNRWDDPKCDFSAFEESKRNGNRTYLESRDQDEFYRSCVTRYCP